MPFLAHYGIVAFVRTSFVNDVLRAVHYRHGERFEVALGRSFPIGGATVEVYGKAFVECPHVVAQAAAGAPLVDLSAWARVELQYRGHTASAVFHLEARAAVPVRFEGEPFSYATPLRLDLSALTLQSLMVDSVWQAGDDPDLALKAPQLAADAAFRAYLVDRVRTAAGDTLRFDVPVQMLTALQGNIVVGGGENIIFAPRIQPAVVRVLDDALAVCFDAFDGSDRLTTGDPAGALAAPWVEWAQGVSEQLNSYHGTNGYVVKDDQSQILVAVDPQVFLRYAQRNVDFQFRLKFEGRDLRSKSAVVSLGHREVSVRAHVAYVHDDPLPDEDVWFTARIVPIGDVLGFRKLETEFDLTLLGDLLEFFTNGVTDAINGAFTKVAMQANLLLPRVGYAGDLPQAGGVPGEARLGVKLSGVRVGTDGLIAGASARVYSPQASEWEDRFWLDDPDRLPPFRLANLPQPGTRDEAVYENPVVRLPVNARRPHIRQRWLRYRTLAHPSFGRDPSLRVRYTVSAVGEDGQRRPPAVVSDHWLDEVPHADHTLDLWQESFIMASRLEIELAYYRPPFVAANVLKSWSIDQEILDRFDRSKPYGRWFRTFAYAVPGMIDDEGRPVIRSDTRYSAIHKSDIRQRCRFADAGFRSRWGGMESLESLPAPDSPPFLNKLCPYCFASG